MATTKYNPYNAIKKIVELKGSYDDAKLTNKDYQQYQKEAMGYYDELVANGYVNQAEILAQSGYRDALDYLNNSGYKPDSEVELDEWVDNIGKVSTGDKSPVNEQYSSWMDDLMGVGTGKTTGGTTDQLSSWLDDMASLSTGKTSPQTSDAVSQLMNQWFADNQTYIDRSGELHNAGLSGLDSLLNYDYTKQSFYQPIMDTYNLYGDNSANGQLASGASTNGGNIDSYAAANAARQQLAFTNAGHQAALAAAAQNQGSYLDLYGMMGDNNSDLRLNNATTLNAINSLYSTDASERQNAVNALNSIYNNAYNTDSEERRAANDVIAQLFGVESAERQNATNAMVDKYLADLGLVQTQYTTDAQERMNTENNEYSLALQKLANEYGMSVAQLEKAAKDYATLMGYNADIARVDADKYATDKNYDATLRETYNKILSEERTKAAENKHDIELENLKHQNELAKLDRENLYNSGGNAAVEASDKAKVKAYVEEAIAAMEEGDDIIKTYNAVLKYADAYDKQEFGGKYSDYIRELVAEYKKYA